MNTGKTYLCNKIQYIATKKNKNVKIINGDEIRRYILSYSHELQDKDIQKKLHTLFGDIIINQDT
jgi:adenylylsulfate kinase-like enzyme